MLSRYARIALLANVALSLVFAYWAFALWFNRIDFEADKKKRDDIIKMISATVPPGAAKLQAVHRNLSAIEKNRPAMLKWYQDQLDELRSGNGPILALVFQKGELQYDLQGHPRLDAITDSANQKIEVQGSLKVLDDKYKTLHDEIVNTRKQNNDAVAEAKKITAEIGNGSAAPGLRWQLAFWQDAERRSLMEQEFVKPLLYNRLVELDILKNRQVALQGRVRELEGAAVTKK
jgi:hypothetical protein